MKGRLHFYKFIFLLIFTGFTATAQDYFRVIGGIPHLPSIDPTAILSPIQGMLIYSNTDRQPMIYGGAGWETLCSSNVNSSTVKNYLEVKTGIPYLSSLTDQPTGNVPSGGIYYSKTDNTMMVYNGNDWTSVAKLYGKGSFTIHSDFSTNNGLRISRLPVLSDNPIPLGLSAGAIYINAVSKSIRYYDGIGWQDITCLPIIATIPPHKITNTAAHSGADVKDNGGSTVTTQGICWGTSSNPDISLSTKTEYPVVGPDTGIFPSIISGLKANTVYYVRAYAINDSGIVYGDEYTFTSALASAPTIITLDISDFTPVSANSGGFISSDGGAPITARGITWSTVGDPELDPNAVITSDGSGVGTFPSRLTDLLRNTTYYVRAYAVNVMGKAYGNLIIFTTPSATAPVMSSPNIKIVDITDVSAVSEVTIINNGGEPVLERGMSWSTDRINVIHGPSTQVNPTDIGTFVCNITGLKPGTLYYVKAYAKNIIGTSYSSESSFITTSLPTLTTIKPYNYDAASHRDGWFAGYNGTLALSGGDITSNGVSLITKKGICWSTSPNPDVSLSTKTEIKVTGSGTGTFHSYLTSLTPGTTYYVRAYAINSFGTAYGDEMVFTTPQLPDLITKPGKDVSSTNITSGGDIVDNGRMPINTQGICWNTTNNPDITDPHVNVSVNGTSFEAILKNLMGSTTYYIRAYATNYVGTNYGNVVEVTTAAPVKPSVITAAVNGTAGTSTTGGGEVTSHGGAEVTARGVVWSLTPGFTPDLNSQNKSQVAGGTGNFTSPITGLSPNKTYYVRAYAINSVGVEFGEEVVFKTYTIASLITTAASQVNSTGAVSGGDIFSDGGDKVTSSGIVWSTSKNPTIALNTKTQGGTGIGSFIHNIGGLLGSTTYYVRAYATNRAGTAYGNEVSFITGPPIAPSLKTVDATDITGSTALSGGVLLSNGGALLSKIGVVWSRVSGFTPDLSSPNKTTQSGQGNFSSNITGLTPGTVYYVRAYAENAVGLVFGQEVVFKTASLAVLTTLKPIPGSITSVSATSGGTIISNGGSYIRSNGICWSTAENPTTADKHMVAGSGSGNFTANATDLFGSTTYYIRAFATNFAGTAYGQQEHFTTPPPVPSTVITLKITDVTGTTANSGGNITSNGGALVSTRGLVWSTNQGFDPATVTNERTAETGYEKGIFYSQMKGLTPGTTYYVRAYAVSIAGTSYGEELSFTTPNMAVVVTNSPNLVTNTTVAIGGTVTDSGGSPVTRRGVIWSTVENFDPTSTSLKRTNNGSGIGSYNSLLEDLIPDTKYYIRAYAITIAGTSYGQQIGITTYPPTLPVLTTVVPNRITGVRAYSGGAISDEGGVTAETRGVYWSTVPHFKITDPGIQKTTQTGEGKGTFPSQLTGLTEGTTYYVRAYASNRVGTAYGNELSFTTQSLPILTTINITANNGTTAMSGGVISSDGDAPVTTQGVVWSTSPNPTIGLATKTSDIGSGIFTSKLSGLLPITTYYVRAYATNAIGTAYGNEISFTTTPIVPTLTSSDAVITSNTTASAGGTITKDGGAAITERGIVFSPKANFDPAKDAVFRTSDGQGMGTFISELYGLEKSRTYYYRAYAVNSAGTAYGNQLTIAIFATSPILITNKVTDIAGTTATSGGEITNDGGALVTKRGICWSTDQNPTINLSTKTSDLDLGEGKFVSRMTGLLPNTQYYVRAYAINGIGVAYGLEESFITLALPTLTATDPVINIRATTATSGGEITDDGRTPITNRGIVWSTYSNPTIALSTKTTDYVTQGIGSFTASMNKLTPNTTYYVRAYATNSVGTNYGSETFFKSNVVMLPTLTTSPVTDIEGYSAKAGGDVTDDGGMPVVTRGVVWSLNSNPTIDLPTKIVNGTAGNGIFENVFAGLIPGTTYYVRAFATNSVGTAYGNEVSFVTSAVVPGLSNVLLSNATLKTVDAKANVVFDGGSAITDFGFAWNTLDFIPLAPDQHLSTGNTGTDILGTIPDLLPATKYFVWAYASNAIGSGYSLKSVSLTTPDVPTVITTKASGITATGANAGGNVTNNGGVVVTARGVIWSTTKDLGIDTSAKTVNGTGNGGFTSAITDLVKGTTYYFRAYATNAMGTGYGLIDSLRTIDIPVLTTSPVANILSTSAIGGGEITSDGGGGVTARGVVWDTAEEPTIDLTSKTANGSGKGIFSSNLSPLSVATKYYVRAYATNTAGTAYGQQETFTSMAVLPTVVFTKLGDMTLNSVTALAEVTDDGGAEVTSRGFVWSFKTNPTLADSTIASGAGIGDFTGLAADLEDGPTYYMRAYATNSAGTAYSKEMQSFKICNPVSVIHTAGLAGAPVDKTVTYQAVSLSMAGAPKCWITSNLGASQEATSLNDASEYASGWYWQFNRLQGYKHDGTTRTPNLDYVPWITSIGENSGWSAATDPCVQLLGGGWHVPTAVEWTAAAATPQNWTSAADGYASVLKLHAAGNLAKVDGNLVGRGVDHNYWSSDYRANTGISNFFSNGHLVSTTDRAIAMPIRCIRDGVLKSIPSVSNVSFPVSEMTEETATGSATVTKDGGAKVTVRGFVWNTTGTPTTAHNVIPLGTGTGIMQGLLADLEEGDTYFVRAFATNSEGTAYSPLTTSFKICNPVTVIHKGGLKGAAVDKTVTYKTISSSVTGAAACWLAQNLGAGHMPDAVNDNTEESAGWYWQFNRLQGYKHDGVERTPNLDYVPWITSIGENSPWAAAVDPCVQLLGGGWRIPTSTEWRAVVAPPQNWKNVNDAFASELNLHAAGTLSKLKGDLTDRGTAFNYWGSDYTPNTGVSASLNNGFTVSTMDRAIAMPIRCIRDAVTKSIPSVSEVLFPVSGMTEDSATGTATVTNNGGAKVTERGFVWNTTGAPTTAHHVIKLGTGTGIMEGMMANLEEGPTYYVRAYATNSIGTAYSLVTTSFKICNPVTIIHKAGMNGAAVDKTVTYQTVSSSVSGTAKCWITQNLGASATADALNDNSEANAGWYWQFNRLQGYKHDGTVRTPDIAYIPWITSITENSPWAAAVDPCVQLLGGGWRIPTSTEWRAVVAPPQNWKSMADAYDSELKLHAAGHLTKANGSLNGRGTIFNYWSSDYTANTGNSTSLNNGFTVSTMDRAIAMPIRCLRDAVTQSIPSVTTATIPVSEMTKDSAKTFATVTNDGGAKVTARGFVWNTTGLPTVADNVVADGIGTGNISGVIANLIEGPTYYVRAFATNSQGTAYSPIVSSFKICNPVTIIHKAGMNGAAVDKTVVYQTVSSNVSGTAKCWITQNLGADRGANAMDDVSETAAGWYWQFNRLQAYQHDGTNRTPDIAYIPWVTSITENSPWAAAVDPCVQLLGGGWRIPTSTEWRAVVDPPQNWKSIADAFNSELKLHAAGNLTKANGSLNGRGTAFNYWGSDYTANTGNSTSLNNGFTISLMDRAIAMPIRCLRDNVTQRIPSVTDVNVPVAEMTHHSAKGFATVTNDGGAKVTTRGFVWNTTGTPTIADNLIADGNGTGDISGLVVSLIEGPTYYVRAFATNSLGTAYSPTVSSFKICNPVTVIHRAGMNGAAVDKTVTYQTVSSNVSGAARCWITQNLGADRGADAADDTSDAAAGWYWQFNRLQAYQHDGTDRTPNVAYTPWVTSLSGNGGWDAALDPCIQLLGGGWRIPTPTEWSAAAAPPQNWKSIVDGFKSELKLHAAGNLAKADGSLNGRGTVSNFWSNLYIANGITAHAFNGMASYTADRAIAMSIRCLRDAVTKSIPSVTNADMRTAHMTSNSAKGFATVTNDGGAPVTARGFVWGTSGIPTTANNVLNDATGTGDISAVIAGLTEGPTYYVRAFATNSVGTAYSPVVSSFKICNPFTVTHVAGVNGAAVDKTVTYQTISSNVSGAAKCWITQNLGSDRIASTADDATEASAGWYWQFNRLQGYKHDGLSRSPAITWVTSLSGNAGWAAALDPCTQLLGGGWRIPSQTEWAAAAAPPQFWRNFGDPFRSELKLHAAGYLAKEDGMPKERGTALTFWANLYIANGGNAHSFNGTAATTSNRAIAMPVRCIKD
ncbi:hypothetical protein ABDJ41_07015 [Pedobacter sp. ASV1-7]|uniref:hypothetical protein n=1 Tax=Pedobacter sp. ASV1-7 TaxID=3145237 RepID=UPI0032E8894E